MVLASVTRVRYFKGVIFYYEAGSHGSFDCEKQTRALALAELENWIQNHPNAEITSIYCDSVIQERLTQETEEII